MKHSTLSYRSHLPVRAELPTPESVASPGTGIEDDDMLDIPDDARPEVQLLRTQQRYALEDLIAGKSYNDAARGAGVDRRTLYRWMKNDPAFRAALEGWRRRAVRSAEDRLTQGAHDAAATLTAAARSDYRAAAILLKSRGLLGGKSAASSTVIEQIFALPPAKRRLVELRLREMILSFREDPEDPAPSAMPALPALLESTDESVRVSASPVPIPSSAAPGEAAATVVQAGFVSDSAAGASPLPTELPAGRYIFDESLLPAGFRFPEAYLRLMHGPILPNLGPWWLIGTQYDTAMFWHTAVRANEHAQSLIPFAKRDAGVHTLAAFDGADTSGNPKVFHIPAYSDPAPADPQSWNSFEEWLADAQKEAGEHDRGQTIEQE